MCCCIYTTEIMYSATARENLRKHEIQDRRYHQCCIVEHNSGNNFQYKRLKKLCNIENDYFMKLGNIG